MKNLNDILNSAEFESMFNFEAEKKEISPIKKRKGTPSFMQL